MASRQLAHLGGKQCRDEDRNAPLPMGFAFKYSDAYNITYVFQGGVFDPANLPAWFVRVLDPRRDGCCETTSALYRHLCIIGSSQVLPLSVVDNSVFSPNRLTVLSTLFLLLYKKASLLPISSGEDSSDASCVLAPALVCPPVLSRAAVFPLLAPSWSCPGGRSNQPH